MANPFKPHDRSKPGTRLPPQLARVGDSVECDVRHPFRQTLRLVLETPAAAAHANDLLMDPNSGWRLASPRGVPGISVSLDIDALVKAGVLCPICKGTGKPSAGVGEVPRG